MVVWFEVLILLRERQTFVLSNPSKRIWTLPTILNSMMFSLFFWKNNKFVKQFKNDLCQGGSDRDCRSLVLMQLRKPLLNKVELYIAPPIIQRSSNIRCFFYEQKWEESDISGKPSPVAHPPRQSQLSLSHIPWFYLASFIEKLLFIDCLFSVFFLSFFFWKVCSKDEVSSYELLGC